MVRLIVGELVIWIEMVLKLKLAYSLALGLSPPDIEAVDDFFKFFALRPLIGELCVELLDLGKHFE